MLNEGRTSIARRVALKSSSIPGVALESALHDTDAAMLLGGRGVARFACAARG